MSAPPPQWAAQSKAALQHLAECVERLRLARAKLDRVWQEVSEAEAEVKAAFRLVSNIENQFEKFLLANPQRTPLIGPPGVRSSPWGSFGGSN